MLYWESKRRLALLRRFHEQITAYFGNIEYASWMVGGGPNENKTAQNARREINMMMRDVAESLDSHGIPQDVLYRHPPALRLPSQVVDVIQNILSSTNTRISDRNVCSIVLSAASGLTKRNAEN